MNTIIWIAQIGLAMLFLATGGLKVSQPKEQLLTRMHALEDVAPAQIKLIGAAELMATAGLTLPHLTGILPLLTPVAAVGSALLLGGAIVTHIRRGESFLVPAIAFVLALFVAYGRFVLVPA